jgi:hypothetical protein
MEFLNISKAEEEEGGPLRLQGLQSRSGRPWVKKDSE